MTTWLALLGGFSVLVIEILGVHLLSPWFGNSTIIWSQQIAIILLAMALGAWMGGNIAKSKQRLYSKLSLALGAAAVFFVLLAFGIDLLAVAILPTELGLEQVAGLFQIGSFASAIIFFAPPVFFLAWITPLLVEIRVEAGANAGQASGRLGAIATAGSLLGIYFSTFIAIPWLGVSASIIVVAILLAGSALVVSHRAKQLPLLAILFLFQYLPQPSTTAHLPSGANVVESLRTPYQKLRIIEFEDGERWLQMNEGLDSFQSKWLPGQQWPGGYYDLFALLPIYINYQSPRSSTTEYCILGYGAGSAVAPIAMGQGNDNWHLTGIELDPIVNELSNRHMPLSKDFNSKVAVWSSIDARAALRYCQDELDGIVVDAYSRQFEVPPHMATQDFFQEIYDKLSRGGVMCFNLGTSASKLGDNSLSAITAGVIGAFGEGNVRLQHVARSRNWVVFARKEMVLPPLQSVADLMPEGWPIEIAASCLPHESFESNELSDISAHALTDDRNSIVARQFLEWGSAQ